MTRNSGDDLVAARRFTNLCQKHMSEMFFGTSLPANDVLDRLGDIQSHAKLMHARAIYRAAQNVVDDLTFTRSDETCAASVLCLQKLISQYEAGLDELAPNADSVPSEVKTHIRQVETAAQTDRPEPIGANLVSDMAAQKTAKDILGGLIQYADGADQKILRSLINLASNDELPKTVPVSIQRDKIDVIMPAITNHWLRIARCQDKSVSVSFMSDEAMLDRDVLKTLRAGLQDLGETLISNVVETAKARKDRGLNQTAHLSVTARKGSAGYVVSTRCSGEMPADFEMPVLDASLAEQGARLFVRPDGDDVTIEIVDLPLSSTATRQAREAV